MKKVSLLLCVAILVSLLAGCGGGDDLTGTWEATIDVSETIGGSISETMSAQMPDLKEYLDFSELSLVVKTTFNADGTYTSKVTEESFTAMMEVAVKKAAEGLTNYMTEVLKEYKVDMEIKEVFGLAEGETLEDKMKDEIKIDELKKIVDTDSQSGVYKAEDGKLYTAEKPEGFSDSKYENYELNEDQLVLTGSEGMEEYTNSIMVKVYPMTFKKIG